MDIVYTYYILLAIKLFILSAIFTYNKSGKIVYGRATCVRSHKPHVGNTL